MAVLPFETMSGCWTKETALVELQTLAGYTAELAKEYPFSAEHTRWVNRTLAVLEEVFGGRSRYFLSFASYTWHFAGSLVVSTLNLDEQLRQSHQQAYLSQL